MTLRDTHPHTMAGTKHLWFEPDAVPLTSKVRATLTPVAGGSFYALRYEWTKGDAPHEGAMLIHRTASVGAPAITWADSFHQSGALMSLNCETTTPLGVVGLGAYAAPPGPDWGWRISVEWPPEGGLDVHMTNIWPSGQEDRAVRITLR